MCRLLAQTSLRNILGTKNLHEILSDRESIALAMQVIYILYIYTQHKTKLPHLGLEVRAKAISNKVGDYGQGPHIQPRELLHYFPP